MDVSPSRLRMLIERAMDANLDRAVEGARVVEDVARFVLNDFEATARLRKARHALAETLRRVPGLRERLVAARDSTGDVGRAAAHTGMHADLLAVVEANLGRAQEAVRALEELARCLAPEAASSLALLRFDLYDIERDLLPRLQAFSARARLEFELYVVIGAEFCAGRDVIDVAKEAVAGGARAIQLREKNAAKKAIYHVARRLRDTLDRDAATLIINDHLDIAMAVEADGVHLGQDDLPIERARELAGPGLVLGASTHNTQQARRAMAAGATYVNCGPVFPTQTKATPIAPVGLGMVQAYAALARELPCGMPFTVMGGIKADNAASVIAAGADRVAVVTAVTAAPDVAAAARALLDAIRAAKQARRATAMETPA